MKKHVLISLLAASLPMLIACGEKPGGDGNATYRDVQVELSQTYATVNGAGDAAYSFLDVSNVAYTTDAGDSGTASVSEEGRNSISGSFKVNEKAAKLWCYTPEINISAQITKNDPETSASFEGMAFCTNAIALGKKTNASGNIKPVTAAVVLDVIDIRGIATGKSITSVTMTADDAALAGQVTLNLQEGTAGEVKNASSSISFSCSGMKVGSASLGAVVLPCNFTGTITVEGDGFSGSISVTQPITLQAGYVKHITVDVDRTRGSKGFPKRLGIIGDSISTFQGIIPPDHRAYYTNPPASGCDVTSWEKTYWGLLITDYWKCELDVNTSWSGSSVADGKEGSVRTPFVDHSRLDLFKNPDTIILFGGTNDAIASNGIGLGEFNYETPLDQMNTTKRFRDAYIYVIRYLQEKHPGVQIICIIGTDINGDYGTSVETIAKHFNLPYVDFRGEKNVAGKVTIYSGSHPDAAGHAYKAKKIYEETLSLFQ